MAKFFIPKTLQGTINVSVVREDGHRLSFAADDSCGAAKTHIRTYLQEHDDSKDTPVSEEEYAITPVQYLFALAEFLGYKVVKNDKNNK